MGIKYMLDKDAILDVVVKIINFVKLPTFYLILSLLGAQSSEVVYFSTNMSLVFWVCSVLSFGYQDFLNRELTFISTTSDRRDYILKNLSTLLLYLSCSIILIFSSTFIVSFIEINIDYVDKFILLAAIGLFFKNTIANTARSFGAFRVLFFISIAEFILFCSVGAILLYAPTETNDKIYLNVGVSGYILLLIMPILLHKVGFKFKLDFYLGNIFNLSIFSSLFYLNIFWGTSYFIKAKFDPVSHNEAFLYDIFFIAIGPLIAMTLSFLHIKNIISRNSIQLGRIFCFGTAAFIALILITFPYVGDLRFTILLCLLCLIFAVEAFGFNNFSIFIFAVYAALVYTASIDNISFTFGLVVLFGSILPFYPKFVKDH